MTEHAYRLYLELLVVIVVTAWSITAAFLARSEPMPDVWAGSTSTPVLLP